jgi:hypothetical protein
MLINGILTYRPVPTVAAEQAALPTHARRRHLFEPDPGRTAIKAQHCFPARQIIGWLFTYKKIGRWMNGN